MNLVFTKLKNISTSNNIIKKPYKVASKKNILRNEIKNIKAAEKKKFKIQQNKNCFATNKVLSFVVKPTLKYNNNLITKFSQPINVKKKFVNLVMKDGKKSKAYTILQQALKLVYHKNLFYTQKAKSNLKITQKLYVKNKIKEKEATTKKTDINIKQKTYKKNAKINQVLFKDHQNQFNVNLPKFNKINKKTDIDFKKIVQHITQINKLNEKTAHVYLTKKKLFSFFFRLKSFKYFLNWLKKRSLKKQFNKVKKLMLTFNNFSNNKECCSEKIKQKKQQVKKETSFFSLNNSLIKKKTTELNLNKFVIIRRKIKQSMFTENLLLKAIENVKPSVEVRSVKVAGRSYQVPAVISKNRQQILAIKWIIDFAKKKQKISSNKFSECLALELFDALKNSGKVKQKRDFLHKQAESNRAYMRFKWW